MLQHLLGVFIEGFLLLLEAQQLSYCLLSFLLKTEFLAFKRLLVAKGRAMNVTLLTIGGTFLTLATTFSDDTR